MALTVSGIRDVGRAASNRFDHHEAKRLGPLDREEKSIRVSEKALFVFIVDLADELHSWVIKQGLHNHFKIFLVNAIDLGSDLERVACPTGDLNGAVRALLGRNPPKKREILPRRCL